MSITLSSGIQVSHDRGSLPTLQVVSWTVAMVFALCSTVARAFLQDVGGNKMEYKDGGVSGQPSDGPRTQKGHIVGTQGPGLGL